MTLKINCDTDLVTRPPVSPAIVPARGPFTFPEPYGTQATRLTNPDDGLMEPVGYAYWRNINAHGDDPFLLVFVGRTNALPLLLRVNKATLDVERVKELMLNGTAERWHFSATRPHTLYAELVDSRLLRYDVMTDQVEVIVDVTDHGFAGHVLWQAHTSDDDNVHSATLKNPSYQPIASVAYRESDQRFWMFPAQGSLDECQIDKSGRWLVIKEDDKNRIIDLETSGEFTLVNEAGALGHSDCGLGCMVGEDDMLSVPGGMRLWHFEPDGRVSDGKVVYHMTGWDPMARHVSYGAPNLPYVIISCAHRNALPRANEIVRTTLDGSLNAEVLAPTLIDLNAGGGDDYRKLPKANCDVTGQYVVWSSNLESDRLDWLLLKAPI